LSFERLERSLCLFLDVRCPLPHGRGSEFTRPAFGYSNGGGEKRRSSEAAPRFDTFFFSFHPPIPTSNWTAHSEAFSGLVLHGFFCWKVERAQRRTDKSRKVNPFFASAFLVAMWRHAQVLLSDFDKTMRVVFSFLSIAFLV
jgi:hypothetical protein